MGENRNSTFDEEMLARCAYALGYDLARALAVMGDAFARGLAGGIGCLNGMRFRPREEWPCEEYEEAAGYNNG